MRLTIAITARPALTIIVDISEMKLNLKSLKLLVLARVFLKIFFTRSTREIEHRPRIYI